MNKKPNLFWLYNYLKLDALYKTFGKSIHASAQHPIQPNIQLPPPFLEGCDVYERLL